MLVEPFNGDPSDRGLSEAASRLSLLKQRNVSGYSVSIRKAVRDMLMLRNQMNKHMQRRKEQGATS
jgi:hypothetical protein